MNYIRVNVNKVDYNKVIEVSNGFVYRVIYSETETEYKCYEFFSVNSLTEKEIEDVETSISLKELKSAIKFKQEEIDKYDKSEAVNSFIYNDKSCWLDKATRVGLMNSTKILKDAGETTASLWLDNLHVVLPVDDIIDKLSQLEVYALECYNVTAQHKVAVSGLQTVEEVQAYDITSGYPTKLDLT